VPDLRGRSIGIAWSAGIRRRESEIAFEVVEGAGTRQPSRLLIR